MPSQVDHEQLLKALYWIWDAFDRANVPFFLVYETYDCAVKQRDLHGDKVEVGIKRTEWVSGGRRLLDAFLGDPLEETEARAVYQHEGVPVVIHIFEPSACIEATDALVYRAEGFSIPNPYKTFIELYG